MSSAKLSLGDALTAIGLSINMARYDSGVSVTGGPPCFSCSHGPRAPIADLVRSFTERNVTDPKCALLEGLDSLQFGDGVGPLTLLLDSFLKIEAAPTGILKVGADAWRPQWDSILVAVDPSSSPKDIIRNWGALKVQTHAQQLLEELTRELSAQAKFRIRRTPKAPEKLVFIHPLDESIEIPSAFFFEQHYGPSGAPGVILLPERLLCPPRQKVTIRNFVRREKKFLPKYEMNPWILGNVPCTPPVVRTQQHTLEVMEIASVLRDTMPLEEAIQSAVEI